MKTLYLRWCSYITILAPLVCLLGCSVPPTPTPSPSSTPLSATSAPTSSSSNTPISSPSPEMPTRTPSPTWTPSPPTSTPAPTLTADEEQKLVLDLFQDNAGCQLPCWWGFTPGETSWQTAQEFFTSLGKTPDSFHSPRGTTNYAVNFPVPEQISQDGIAVQDYFVRDGVIEMIWAVVGDSQSYVLPQLLATYGQPTEIWLKTFSMVADTDGEELPFSLLLDYQHQGMLVEYIGFAYRRDNLIPICLQRARGALWLWPPEHEMTLEDIARTGVGGSVSVDGVPDFRSLEEATGMSVEQFYQTFVQPDNQTCFETPVDMWP